MKNKMLTKQQIINYWRKYVLPEIIEEEEGSFADKPRRRESFNVFTDCLCKEGRITTYMYNNICLPKRLEIIKNISK